MKDQDALTSRQIEVLTLLAGGKKKKEISSDLYISVGTVAMHIATIYLKLGVHSQAEATARAEAMGLMPYRPK